MKTKEFATGGGGGTRPWHPLGSASAIYVHGRFTGNEDSEGICNDINLHTEAMLW